MHRDTCVTCKKEDAIINASIGRVCYYCGCPESAMYKPCSFDRQEYLNNSEEFETISLHDVDSELSEQNEEPESLAYELAYTRYALAKIEAEVAENRIRVEEMTEEVQLFDGDALKILPESKEFSFKCCDCGLVHLIKIKREDDGISLVFHRPDDYLAKP